jgi:hypothetical protein
MNANFPHITVVDNRPRLIVDGHPFLILGLQWECDSCFSPTEMNPLFDHAARLGCNTAVTPVYWREIEPEPDQFNFEMVDERLKQARANGLKLILLWFGTWKNGHTFYVPVYIKENPDLYRMAVGAEGERTVSLCPTGEETWQRDCRALTALMDHIRHVDTDHTVIVFQVENEPGIVGSDRCYCETCNALFAEEKFADRYGPRAGESFSATTIARYIDRLSAVIKEIHPLPLYVNAALSPRVAGQPGKNYFSGGPVPEVLDIYLDELHHVDFVAPDIYRIGYRDFHDLCRVYTRRDNPLYIAEHSSQVTGRAERNVFYAIGEHGAIGFDLWAIDSTYPDRGGTPFVDVIGGEWGPHAPWLRDSYIAIGRAMSPIVEAQGTDRIFTFVQEAAEASAGWHANGVDVVVQYTDPNQAGRGLIIQQGPAEFLSVGVGFTLSFHHPSPDGRPIRVRSMDWGYYEGDAWHLLHPVQGARTWFFEPGVGRILLESAR